MKIIDLFLPSIIILVLYGSWLIILTIYEHKKQLKESEKQKNEETKKEN